MTLLSQMLLHKLIIWIKITSFRQIKYLMKINTYTNEHFLRKIEIFIRIWHFVIVYRPKDKKSCSFLKASMFYKMIISFSSCAHLMKKSTFLEKFHFLCTKMKFLHENWYWQNYLSLCPKNCTTLFITLPKKKTLFWAKTNTFCIKWSSLPKENNITKNQSISK